MKQKQRAKKFFYIGSFTFLGVLVQFVLHALSEMAYIALLTADFSTFSFGLSWDALWRLHHILSVLLFVSVTVFGFWQGLFWWERLYEHQKITKKSSRNRGVRRKTV